MDPKTTHLEISRQRPREWTPFSGNMDQQISSTVQEANTTFNVAPCSLGVSSASGGTGTYNEALPVDGPSLHPAGVFVSSESGDLLLEKEEICPSHPRPPTGPRHGNRRKSKSGSDTEEKSILHDLQQSQHALSQRETHIFSERRRRKDMSDLFAALQTLLPEAKTRRDRCTILTEVMEYLMSLQEKLRGLTRKKEEIIAQLHDRTTNERSVEGKDGRTDRDCRSFIAGDVEEESNVQVSIAAHDISVASNVNEIFITFTSPKKKGLWAGILATLHNHNVEVINMALSSPTRDTYFHCIHAKVPNDLGLVGIDNLQKMLPNLLVSGLES